MPDPSKTRKLKMAMPPGPLPQHKRMAAGEKVSGQQNPNGAPPPREKKVGNAKVTY